MLPNVPYFAALLLRRRCAPAQSVVPMNVLLKRREVAFYLGDSGAKLLFAWHGFAEDAAGRAPRTQAPSACSSRRASSSAARAAPIRCATSPTRDDDDTAVILYTSGTTGTPKGAELTHAQPRAQRGGLRRTCSASAPKRSTLGALPLFHSFGQTCALNATIAGGGTLTLIPRFDPARRSRSSSATASTSSWACRRCTARSCTNPTASGSTPRRSKLCVSGGSALPVELLRGFEQAFGCKILEGYGLSETSPVASFNHPDRERKPGSIGTPVARRRDEGRRRRRTTKSRKARSARS